MTDLLVGGRESTFFQSTSENSGLIIAESILVMFQKNEFWRTLNCACP
jgi:hypothetical protein